MKKIFLDCGSNIGQAFIKFTKTHSIDKSWEVHLFEPNPKCYERLANFQSKNITLHKCAVSDNNKPKMLNVSYSHSEKDWVGGETNILTSESNWVNFFNQSKDHLLVSDSSELSYPKINSNLNKNIIQEKCLEVECVRLVDFIRDNFKREDYIVLKLDIEGSEFAVMDDIITTKTTDYINEIFVEFHERLFDPNVKQPREGRTQLSQRYISLFVEKNIKYGAWH